MTDIERVHFLLKMGGFSDYASVVVDPIMGYLGFCRDSSGKEVAILGKLTDEGIRVLPDSVWQDPPAKIDVLCREGVR